MLRSVKVKTSVALSREVVTAIDRQAGGRGRRSAFIEKAVRSYLTVVSGRHREDLGIINRRAKRLNQEAEDVLSYQVLP
jgi:metal-responsive CopG/Arc/MetJ family transcriptional regulator